MATAVDYSAFLRPVGKAYIYNPGKRTERGVAGETLTIPAKSEKYLDVLREQGREKYLRPEEKSELEALPPGVRPITDMQTEIHGNKREGKRDKMMLSASDVLVHLLGDNGRSGSCGEWGVRILLGDPRQDPSVIREAEDTYKKKLYAHALARIAAHQKQNEKNVAAGLPPAAPTPELLELYKLDAQAKRGGMTGPICDVCHFPTSGDEEMAAHKTEFHGIDSAQPKAVEAGPEAGDVETAVEAQSRKAAVKRARA